MLSQWRLGGLLSLRTGRIGEAVRPRPMLQLALGLALGAVRYDLWRSPPVQTPPPVATLRAVGTLEPTRDRKSVV